MLEYYAIISGACASLGSVFGKLSGGPTLEGYFVVRILCLLLMLLSNAAVWTFYVKALHDSSSTLTATIVSTATNYILAGIFGRLIFGEAISLLWCIGMSLVFTGLYFIISDDSEYCY